MAFNCVAWLAIIGAQQIALDHGGDLIAASRLAPLVIECRPS
jgi:hypothetical protein